METLKEEKVWHMQLAAKQAEEAKAAKAAKVERAGRPNLGNKYIGKQDRKVQEYKESLGMGRKVKSTLFDFGMEQTQAVDDHRIDHVGEIDAPADAACHRLV